MTGWWRRNAVALVAMGVLLPVTVGTVAAQEWSDRAGPREIGVATGGSADAMLATVGPAEAEFLDDPEAPPATRVVTATVRVVPDLRSPLACGVPQLREQNGLQRQWDESSDALGRDYDVMTSCSRSDRMPYTLVLSYIVPEDAAGPFTVDVDPFSAEQVTLRLQVEP